MKNLWSKQKRKTILRTIGTWICVCVMLSIGVLFVSSAIQNYRVLKKDDTGRIITYQGTFIYSEKQYLRNTNLIFTLGNGASICVPCEYIDDAIDFRDFSELKFQYCANKNLFQGGTHDGISIISVDGVHTFLKEGFTKRMLQSSITGFLVVGIPCILLSIVIVVCNASYLIILCKKYQKRQNKRKRHDQN